MDTPVFEFTNYDVEIELAGQKFIMDCSSDTGDYIKKVSEELRDLAKKYAEDKCTKEDVCVYGRSIIDKLLGTGTAKKLLVGRKHELSDIMDICLFLTKVVAEFGAKKRTQAENRAHRRARKNKHA